jgi:HlyD family secretion protein
MFIKQNQFKDIIGLFSSTYAKLSAKVSAALFIPILLLLTWWGTNASEGIASNESEVEHKVAYQTFSSLVQARGELKPARVISIKSNISNTRTKLIYLVADGSYVEQGSVIAQFDKTALMEELSTIEQGLADAQATLELTKRSLSIQLEESEKSADNAKKTLEVAELKARELLEGTSVLRRQKLKLEVKQAQRELEIAKLELDDFNILLERGHVSIREKEKAADKVQKLVEQKTLKSQELDNFKLFEWPKMKREVEILKESAAADYRRTLRVSQIQIQNSRNAIVKATRDHQRVLNRVGKTRQNIAACELIAPISGNVIHKTISRAEGAHKIQVGDNIWSGQTLMEIPDTNKLILNTQIREFDVAKISINLKSKIYLDAYSSDSYDGKVTRINKVVSNGDNGVNRFNVEITIDKSLTNVHVGMSGRADIMIKQIDNKLAVPIHLTSYDDGTYYVWVKDFGQLTKQNFTAGVSNHQWIEVIDGIDNETTIYSVSSN